MADTFDAIADPTRRDILNALLGRGGTGEISAAELAEQIGVTTPTVTKHLGVLRELGFVAAREEGRSKYFSLQLAPFDELQAWLAPFVGDAYDAAPVASEDAVVFSAWAGTDVGSTIGRAIADRSHQARTAFQGASERVTGALPDAVTKRFTHKP
jgi:ArsR family transcriptional regulator